MSSASDTSHIQVLDVLRSAKGVRSVHEDMKMEKLTTYTPEFLEINSGAWPALGGYAAAGEGVVIGLIDTGINPSHPSFTTGISSAPPKFSRFRGKCATGHQFPASACNGKIVGAQYFARAAIAAGDFNATRDVSSPFDSDGHGRQVFFNLSLPLPSERIRLLLESEKKGPKTHGNHKLKT